MNELLKLENKVENRNTIITILAVTLFIFIILIPVFCTRMGVNEGQSFQCDSDCRLMLNHSMGKMDKDYEECMCYDLKRTEEEK